MKVKDLFAALEWTAILLRRASSGAFKRDDVDAAMTPDRLADFAAYAIKLYPAGGFKADFQKKPPKFEFRGIRLQQDPDGDDNSIVIHWLGTPVIRAELLESREVEMHHFNTYRLTRDQWLALRRLAHQPMETTGRVLMLPAIDEEITAWSGKPESDVTKVQHTAVDARTLVAAGVVFLDHFHPHSKERYGWRVTAQGEQAMRQWAVAEQIRRRDEINAKG